MSCASTSMDVYDFRPAPIAPSVPIPSSEGSANALHLYDDYGNGRITCAEAREHGIAPSTPVIPHTSTWLTGTAMARCVE